MGGTRCAPASGCSMALRGMQQGRGERGPRGPFTPFFPVPVPPRVPALRAGKAEVAPDPAAAHGRDRNRPSCRQSCKKGCFPPRRPAGLGSSHCDSQGGDRGSPPAVGHRPAAPSRGARADRGAPQPATWPSSSHGPMLSDPPALINKLLMGNGWRNQVLATSLCTITDGFWRPLCTTVREMLPALPGRPARGRRTLVFGCSSLHWEPAPGPGPFVQHLPKPGSKAAGSQALSPSPPGLQQELPRSVPAAHLHPRLGEVDLEGQLLARVDVGVVRLGKDPLQLLQLRAGERGPDPPLLPLLVDARRVREEFVRHWGGRGGRERGGTAGRAGRTGLGAPGGDAAGWVHRAGPADEKAAPGRDAPGGDAPGGDAAGRLI